MNFNFNKTAIIDVIKRNSMTLGLLIYLLISATFSSGMIGILIYITGLLCYNVLASQFVLYTFTSINFLEHKEQNSNSTAKILVVGIVFLANSLLIALGSWIKFSDIL